MRHTVLNVLALISTALTTVAVALIVSGCFSTPPAPPVSPGYTEQELALDVLEKGLRYELKQPAPAKLNTVQPTESTPAPEGPSAESPAVEAPGNTQPSPDKIGTMLLKYEGYLNLVLYCLIALAGGWYMARTGKESETLTQVSVTVNKRMGLVHRVLYRILRSLYGAVVKKKRNLKK